MTLQAGSSGYQSGQENLANSVILAAYYPSNGWMITRRLFLYASVSGGVASGGGPQKDAASTPASVRKGAKANPVGDRAAGHHSDPRIEEAWSTLSELNQSANLKHRKAAIAAYAMLARTGGQGLTQAAEVLSSDPDLELRAFAAVALGIERARPAIPALKQALNDRSATVAFSAAKALWDMNDHTGAVVFREILAGERKNSQGMVSGYLDTAKHKLHDPKGLAVLGLNEAVGSFFGPAGMLLSFAEQNLKDKTAPIRAIAAAALGDDRSHNAQEILESAAQDSSPLVRAAACRSLGVLGRPESLAFIEPALEDKDEAVRASASAAYIRLHQRRRSG